MRVLSLGVLAALLACLVAAPDSVNAQDYYAMGNVPTVTVSEASFANLMNRLEALEASLDTDGDDGWEDAHGEKWQITWGGRVMVDYVNWAAQDAGYGGANIGRNYLEMRRARFRAEGNGYGIYFWQIELDFAADDDSSAQYDAGGGIGQINAGPVAEMKDVYIGISEVPLLGDVLIGHFKGPFSMEELTSSRYTTFLERALPNYFIPGREAGVMAANRSAGENVTWAYGVFADGLPESTKQLVGSIGTQVVGRATWTPYYDEMNDGRCLLHLGTGIRHVWNRDGLYRLRVRPETHESIRLIDFDGDNDLAERRTVYNAELAWVSGPFSIQSEGFVDIVDVTGAGNTNAYSAYAQASYFLTGENRVYKRNRASFGRVKPLENFWIVRGAGIGSGAWELKTRWSYMDVNNLYNAGFTGDTDEDAEQINNLAVGFNWYWNPYTRVMFDYWHSWSKRGGGAADEADLIGMRMQYDF